jgi:hypothetical protein
MRGIKDTEVLRCCLSLMMDIMARQEAMIHSLGIDGSEFEEEVTRRREHIKDFVFAEFGHLDLEG